MSSDGRVTTALNRLLNATAQPASWMNCGRRSRPSWTNIPMARRADPPGADRFTRKKPVDVAGVMKPLLEARVTDSRMMYIRWIVGQELVGFPAVRSVAIQLYERAAKRT